MADSTLHFAIGLAVGTAIILPGFLETIASGNKTAPTARRLLVTSYALAIYAIIPNLLRHAGLPEFFCNGWWMNIFMFHQLLDKIKPGGMLIGEILLVFFFVLHYLIILACLAKRRNKNPNRD